MDLDPARRDVHIPRVRNVMTRLFSSPNRITVNAVQMGRAHAWIVLGALLLVALALARASLLRHFHLDSAEDLAMFDQMLWSVREGRGLVTSISGNGHLQFTHHFFGEHVSPILYLLAWPAGITPGPEALLVIQAFAVALAAIPLWRLAATLTGSQRLGTVAALVWLVQPALWGATLYDFHMEAFEALFLFAFAHAFITGRWQAWVWGALYASCKEDAPLYLAALAFVLGWQFRRWRSGVAMAVIAGGYGLAATVWIVPVFSPTGAPLLGSRLLTPAGCGGLWEWIREVLLHGLRWGALASHLLALGLLPLLGGRLLLPAAMAVGVMWVSRADPQSLLMWHYPYTTHPLLAIAGIFGLRAIRKPLSMCSRLARTLALHHEARSRKAMSGGRASTRAGGSEGLCVRWFVWAREVAFGAGDPWGRCRGVSPAWHAVVPLLLAAGVALGWRSQGRDNREFTLGRADAGDPAYREARRAMRAIPEDQRVATLLTLAPHLARRRQLSVLLRGREDEVLVLRTRGRTHPLLAQNYHGWLDALVATNSGYGVVAPLNREVLVLRRGGSSTLNAEAGAGPRGVEAEDLRHGIGGGVADARALNGQAWRAGRGDRNGFAIWGPHVRLVPGRYRASFRVRASGLRAGKGAVFDVATRNGLVLLAERALERRTRGYEWVELEFTAGREDVLEFRCTKKGRGTIWLDEVRWLRLVSQGA